MVLRKTLSSTWEWLQAPIRGVGAVVVVGCVIITMLNSFTTKDNSEAAKKSSAAAAAYGKSNHEADKRIKELVHNLTVSNQELKDTLASVLGVVDEVPAFKNAVIAGQAQINAHVLFQDCLLEHIFNQVACGVAPSLPPTTPAPSPAPPASAPATTTTGTTTTTTTTTTRPTTHPPTTTTTTTRPCGHSHRKGCP